MLTAARLRVRTRPPKAENLSRPAAAWLLSRSGSSVFAWSASFTLTVGWSRCCCSQMFASSSGFRILLFLWRLVAVETVKLLNNLYTVCFFKNT